MNILCVSETLLRGRAPFPKSIHLSCHSHNFSVLSFYEKIDPRLGGPSRSRTPLPGLRLYSLLPPLPSSPPAAASQGIPAWVSTAEARSKAACPGRVARGACLLLLKGSAIRRMRAGPRAQGPWTGPQCEGHLYP